MEYMFPVTIDLGKAVGEVGQIIDRVNDSLSTWGVSERVGCRGECGSWTLTVSRELTDEEIEVVRAMIEKGVRERLPDLGLRVSTPCCKPGKSSYQSAAT